MPAVWAPTRPPTPSDASTSSTGTPACVWRARVTEVRRWQLSLQRAADIICHALTALQHADHAYRRQRIAAQGSTSHWPASCSLAAACSPATPAPTTTTSGWPASPAARTTADRRCTDRSRWFDCAAGAANGLRGGCATQRAGEARCTPADVVQACIVVKRYRDGHGPIRWLQSEPRPRRHTWQSSSERVGF